MQQQLLQATEPTFSLRFFVTDIPDRFERVCGLFLGEKLQGVTTVSLD